jgi:hypothetical protein
MDKRFRDTLNMPEALERYTLYTIALLRARKLVPNYAPPPYPAEIRQVRHKRPASATTGNEKVATWVASHLCHNKLCIKVEHLVWEPSWFNRLRDNRPRGIHVTTGLIPAFVRTVQTMA